jgi:hypothetical protein
VSIKCKKASTHQKSWHIGVTKNISVEGVTIEADSLPEVEIHSIVEILCFPKQGFLFSCIPEPEPVKLAGRVIWQDRNKKIIGLEILTTE